MQLLQDAFDAAPEGQQSVVGLSRNNLRRGGRHTFVRKAGIEPWSDVFQTLRRGCATEWKQPYSAYAVDTRVGHRVRVSEKRYLMISDDLWDPVCQAGQPDLSESAARGAAIGAAEGPRTKLNCDEVPMCDIDENTDKQAIPAFPGTGQRRT